MSTTATMAVHVWYPGGAHFIYHLPTGEIDEFVAAARRVGAWVSVVREFRLGRRRHYLHSVPGQAAA